MMTSRIICSGVMLVNDPFKFVAKRLPIVEARPAMLSMLDVWGFSKANEAIVCCCGFITAKNGSGCALRLKPGSRITRLGQTAIESEVQEVGAGKIAFARKS
jgi:hypothetical protein